MVLVILGLIADLDHTAKHGRGSRQRASTSSPTPGTRLKNTFGALGLIYGTLLVSAIAVLLSLPISIGIALFVTDVAPQRLRRPIVYTVDLLAAIPSVVYGLWALLRPRQPLASLFQTVSDATAGHPGAQHALRQPERVGQELHDRRDHRRDHDHADHHLDHP